MTVAIRTKPGTHHEDRAAEAAFIGGFIMAPSHVQDAALTTLTDDMIDDPLISYTLTQARAMRAHGLAVDMVTLPAWVRDQDSSIARANRRTLAVTLHDYICDTPVTGNLPFYADIVRRQAARRQVREAGQRIMQMAGDDSLTDLLDAVRQLAGDAITALEQALPAKEK